MKLSIFIILLLNLISPSYAGHDHIHLPVDIHMHGVHQELHGGYSAEEYEAMSSERERAAMAIGGRIKDILSKAKSKTISYSDISNKISSSPKWYHQPTIKAQWDEALNDLKLGLMCSKCKNSKVQIEENGEDFYAHVDSVGGVIRRSEAKPEDYERVNELYSGRMKTARELQDKLYKLKDERNTLIWSTFAMQTGELNPAYTNSFNYQIQSYATDREQAVEAMKLQAELLHLLNDIVKKLPPTSPDYKQYFVQRYETAKEMKYEIERLNVKRQNKMDSAQRKQSRFIEMNKSIQEVALQLGDDSELGTSGTFVSNSFIFHVNKFSFHAMFLVPESLRSFMDVSTLKVLNDTLSNPPTSK